jgi:hypothetical protein
VIIIDRPPNFDRVLAAFPNADRPGVLFAFDGNVYNPSGGAVPPALIAHENVHLERQKKVGADYWWDWYLTNDEYRYTEELLAHAAEFKMQKSTNDRNFGARLLMATALRLVAPLYNYQPPRTLQGALKDLQQEIKR